jgi:hypothetical protein
MTVLTDLTFGDQFLFVAQVTAIDGAGYHLALYGPGSVQAATALIDGSGTMSGTLTASAAVTPVTLVTGFAPVTAGDVLSSDRTGETLVARVAWITSGGESMWADTPDAKVAYPASGWTVIGHVNL